MHCPMVLENYHCDNKIHVSDLLTHVRTTMATVEEDSHASPMDECILVIAMMFASKMGLIPRWFAQSMAPAAWSLAVVKSPQPCIASGLRRKRNDTDFERIRRLHTSLRALMHALKSRQSSEAANHK